jgi:ribosomal protein L37E
MDIMKKGGPTRPGLLLSIMGLSGSHTRPKPLHSVGSISMAMMAVLVLSLAPFGLPARGLAAEDNSSSAPATQTPSDPSAKQPKKDDKPIVLTCPRCGSTEINLNRCTKCGFKFRTRRARTNTPAFRSGADSNLRSLDSTRQGFQRSMRSLDDSVRRMNTDINRTRTIYRQLR